ncbi:MAG: hypothetical protein E7279_07055 [Lachnospiraceae bacterium]|nr:hypothetical protein [Lachnospiraceae bacterium]
MSKMKSSLRRVGALVLSLIMIASIIPLIGISAKADDTYEIIVTNNDQQLLNVSFETLEGSGVLKDSNTYQISNGGKVKVTVSPKDTNKAIYEANGFTYENENQYSIVYEDINENKNIDATSILTDEKTSLKTLTVSAGDNGNTVINGITVNPGNTATLYTTSNSTPSVQFTPENDCYVSSFLVGIGDAEATQQNRSGYTIDGATGQVTGTLPTITDNASISVVYSSIDNHEQDGVTGLTISNSYLDGNTLYIKEDNTNVTKSGSTLASGKYTYNDGLAISGGDTISSFYVNNDVNTFVTGTEYYQENNDINVVKDDVAPTLTCDASKVGSNYVLYVKNKCKASGKVEDDGSGIRKLEYADNPEMNNSTDVAIDNDGNYNFEFEYLDSWISPQKTFYIRATDNVGNTKTESVVFEKDSQKPVVSALSVANKTTGWGKFIGSSTLKVDYTVTDNKGLSKVTLYDPNGEEIDHNDIATKGTELSEGSFTFNADKAFNGVVKAGGVCDVSKFYIVVTDEAGNPSEQQSLVVTSIQAGDKEVILDNEAPKAELKAASPSYNNGVDNNIYVKQDMNGIFDVTIEDKHSGIKTINVDVVDPENHNDIKATLTQDYSGTPFDKNRDTTKSEKEIYTFATSDIDTAAYGGVQQPKYALHITMTDQMGNTRGDYYINMERDYVAPTITSVKASNVNPENINEHTQATIYNGAGISVNYVAFDNTSMSIEINATDDKSGVKSVTIMNESGSVMTDVNGRRLEKIAPTSAGLFKATIPSYKGRLQVKVYDNVENEKTISTEKIITESVAIHNNENHISISLPQTDNRDISGNNLYNSDVPVSVTVTDTYSGISRVSYEVTSPYDIGANKNAYNASGWSETRDNNIVTSKSGVINVSNNSNDINVKVTVVDNAGNVTSQDVKFSIDKNAPVFSVAYDNYTDNGFYNSARTAILTVKERNFDANNIVTAITNTDGVVPTISGWSGEFNFLNPDDSTYTAFITYSADGDYNTTVFGSDKAGNGGNVIANEAFTVDTVNPQVSVSFDNNNSLNDKYYAADRTATITIVEHNFDAGRVSVNGRASYDGAAAAFPGVSGWSDEGDVHRAVVAFSAEGDYEFDVDVMDLAGNNSGTYREPSFTIDKTNPTITITGVQDKSSNSKDVAPIVTINDVNYDNNGVNVELVGSKNGRSSLGGGFSDINNGQAYTYGNFPNEKEIDDIYTLRARATDKAGNQFESFITFSVNRFGSIYQFDETLNQINGKYVNEAVDVVFSETNVDNLVQGKNKLNLSVNGQPKTLNAGADYTVSESGGDGSWKVYTYTLPKELFKTDGVYIVSSYSEDNAGNINENTANDKNAIIQFAVDKTAPQVVFENLEDDESYNDQEYEARVSAIDNILLSDVEITVDGDKVEATQDGDEYVFTIPEKSSKQEIKAVARDAAGNVTQESAKDVVVTTNAFVRLLNNTWAMVGIIAGLVVVGGVTTLLVLRKKKIIK